MSYCFEYFLKCGKIYLVFVEESHDYMMRKYIIKGLVQGIGYRPFVAKIADELNIDGYVRNTGGIVTDPSAF